jgi:hypothetical protein
MIKILSMAAGLALLAGAASAEPVALSDTNMDAVTAGYSPNVALADATAYALAFGRTTYTNAQAHTFTIVTPYSSESGAASHSAAATN